MLKKLLLSAAFALMASASANAACAYQNTVPIKSLSAGFEAWKAVTAAMAECGNFQAELDQDFAKKHVAAAAANPALYQIQGVAAETFVPLVNDGLIRPLDAYVAKYGQNLSPNQLIKVGGETMAIAMMVNAQHLMYRTDLLEQVGMPAPTTYAQMLEAAKALKAAGLVEYPIGGTFKTGWNLGMEYTNLYLGLGGKFFADDGVTPAINNQASIDALNIMKAMTEYMDPEYLVSDSTYVQQQFQQGKIAMANLWASRAGAMNDPNESTVVGKVAMAAAPAAIEGGKPATTIWWDGFTITKNTPDDQAEAAFRLAMEGLDEEMVKANNDAAVWLVRGYVPGPLAAGAAASAAGGAPSYPASAALGVLHTAIGNQVSGFLTGEKTAEQTIAAIEGEYATAAREKGLIK